VKLFIKKNLNKMTDSGDSEKIAAYYEFLESIGVDVAQYEDMFISACAIAASVRAEACIERIKAFSAIPTLTEKDRVVGPTDYFEYMGEQFNT